MQPLAFPEPALHSVALFAEVLALHVGSAQAPVNVHCWSALRHAALVVAVVPFPATTPFCAEVDGQTAVWAQAAAVNAQSRVWAWSGWQVARVVAAALHVAVGVHAPVKEQPAAVFDPKLHAATEAAARFVVAQVGSAHKPVKLHCVSAPTHAVFVVVVDPPAVLTPPMKVGHGLVCVHGVAVVGEHPLTVQSVWATGAALQVFCAQVPV